VGQNLVDQCNQGIILNNIHQEENFIQQQIGLKFKEQIEGGMQAEGV
jgi:hypothetical protein